MIKCDNYSYKEIYDEFLFHFELYENLKSGNLQNQSFIYTEKQISKFKPQMILECKVIEALDSDDEKSINTKIEKALEHDLVILRNFLNRFRINHDFFKIEYLLSKINSDFRNYKIDVVEQNPNFFGFLKNKQIKTKWRLSDYLDYVKRCSKFFKNEELIKNNCIFI